MIRLLLTHTGAGRRERRSLRYAILMIMIVTACSHSLHAQWTKLAAPELAGVFLYDIQFKSASVGYAIGSKGSTTRLYKTTDGGGTWGALSGLGMVPYGFGFFDESTGMAGGYSAPCKCMAVSRTTDGGESWKLDSVRTSAGELERVPTSFGIYTFSFVDDMTGYASGARGAILKTTDRGASWRRLTIERNSDLFGDLSFTTAEHGIAIAAPLENLSYPSILYRTTDGGESWKVTPDFIAGASFGKTFYLRPQVAFMVGADSLAAIYKTVDGGETWVRTFTQGTSQDAMYDMVFQDQNIGYAVGTNGMIARTTDGGDSWTLEESGVAEVLQGIWIFDGTVHAVGANGTVLRRSAGASGVGSAVTPSAPVLAPNPMTATATISHPDLRAGGGHLLLYDLLGREVGGVTSAPGEETLRLSRDDLSSGMYIYRLIAGAGMLATGTIVVR